MKKILFATLASVVFASVASAQSGGVAVLDIDAVARQLGVEEKVRVDLIGMQNSLNQELQKTQGALQNQMMGVERAAGENPTEEQRRQIVATNQQLNSEFNRLKSQAQNTLAQERVRLINEFRIQLEPIALKAAKAKGMDVVLMKVTPPVFAYTAEVDITQDTAKLAEEAGMKVEVTAAPAAAPAATPVAAPAAGGNGGKAKEKAGKAKAKE
ncbi:MAG: OmpH family outer membrane protein [Verrucomicrobiales bacterium]|nr:OmpH family outer membrane protein [Verrucomicrobiales bacterium]